jgi:adenosylmethionine-8-amino-7-oxononanoate aminotransferase
VAIAPDHLLLHFARNGDYRSGASDLLVLDRGEGSHVYDVEGNRYVDGLSSLFCAQIGYSYGDEMAAVAAAQLSRLPFNTLWSTAHQPAIELSDRLADLAPDGLSQVFLTSGGSEAVEAAWKLVRQFHVANGEPRREKAIARNVAYHGVTLGALALTGVRAFKEQFGRPAIPTRHVSTTSTFRTDESASAARERLLAEVEDAILAEGPETVAMIVAEPVQNSGGCFTPPPGYWPGLRDIADRYGVLLVADEVITGMGRLGSWFGGARYEAAPDLITLAKGMTSAYAPLGAVVASDAVAAPLFEAGRPLLHGVTFGGHPLSAAIALKNIEIFERDGVLENVRAREPYLRRRLDELRALPIVGDVRGDGFFWALELVADDEDGRFEPAVLQQLIYDFLPERLRRARLIARADNRGDAVVQIAPPLVADDSVLDEIVDALAAVLVDAGDYVGRMPAASEVS